jgi:hypothetical protein
VKAPRSRLEVLYDELKRHRPLGSKDPQDENVTSPLMDRHKGGLLS